MYLNVVQPCAPRASQLTLILCPLGGTLYGPGDGLDSHSWTWPRLHILHSSTLSAGLCAWRWDHCWLTNDSGLWEGSA